MSIVGDDTVGIITPFESQLAEARSKWLSLLGRPVLGSVGDPYGDSEAEIIAAGRQLANDGAGWIVMDCIGYTEHIRALVATATGVPVLLVRRSPGCGGGAREAAAKRIR